MRVYLLIIILLLVIFLLSLLRNKETFIVPQNSDVIDETKFDLYSNNLRVITDILNKKYGSYKSENKFTDIDKIDSVFTTRIKNYMLNELKYNTFSELSTFSKFYVDISTPFSDCKYKYLEKNIPEPKAANLDIDTTAKPNTKSITELIISFTTTLSINNVHQYERVLDFLAYPVTIILKIRPRDPSFNLKNIDILKKYKDDYLDLINFEILNISINQMQDISVPFKPIDKLYENRYRITNELHLLTPFKSSYDEMIVTDKMKLEYEKSIPQLKNIQAPIYKPFIN